MRRCNPLRLSIGIFAVRLCLEILFFAEMKRRFFAFHLTRLQSRPTVSHNPQESRPPSVDSRNGCSRIRSRPYRRMFFRYWRKTPAERENNDVRYRFATSKPNRRHDG